MALARGLKIVMSAPRSLIAVAAGARVRLATVYCLGLCSVGPAARIGDDLHARLDEAALVALVDAQ